MPRPAWLAVGAALGSLGLGLVPPLGVALVGCALGLVAVMARALREIRTARWVGVLAIGVLVLGLRGGLDGPTAGPGAIPAGDGPWQATIQAVASPRAGTRPATIDLETAGGGPVLVAATLPWYPAVGPGDRVEVRGRVRPPPDDDYGDYLRRIGAVGTLRADSLELLPAEDSLGRMLEGLRRLAAAGLEGSMPEPEAGLAAGVLIGLRDRVDRDLAAAFTTAGASHVVAISGWNIAIVASALGAVAGGLRRRRRALLTLAAIVLYVAFVGPTASVVRAAVMAGVALLARELGRPGTAAAALGWAVTGLLLLDPAWIDDAGFRLSVLATAGILAWGSSLTARLAGPDPGRPRRWIAEILGVSFAAQAATTPIVLLDFGRLSLVAPAVNLIVVPLVPPAMAAGALALVVGVLVGLGLPAVLATLVGLPAWALYATMVGTVRLGAGIPLASVELGAPWDLAGALGATALIVAAARWGDAMLASWRASVRRVLGRKHPGAAAPAPATRRRSARARPRPLGLRLAVASLVGATIGLALTLVHRPDGLARVVVLDVGQGDGILVEGGRGGRLVVDGGPDPGRLLLALDERLPPWDRRIDILVLSHPHEDHVAGLALLLERYRVGRVYEPGMLGPGPGYEAWSEHLAAGGPPRGRLSTGDRLTVDTIQFRVLWPDPNRVPERPPDGGTSINNVSIVLLGEVGPQRFLLMGDIEEGVDPELIARGLPTVDLLKVAHHGSRTASTEAFLAAVRPRVAVVSAGAGNPYGHPTPETLARLNAVAHATYRTDGDGSVEVTFTGQDVRVSTSGPRPTPKPRATPGGTALGTALRTALRTAGPRAGTVAFLCGVPALDGGPGRAVQEPPVAPEAPPTPTVAFGSVARATAPGPAWPAPPAAWTRGPAIGRLPEPAEGPRTALAYHRPDGYGEGVGDRSVPRHGPPHLLLGRLLRARGGRRGVPEGPGQLPRRRSGALAPRIGWARPRPPPRRNSRAPGHGLDVGRKPRDRLGAGALVRSTAGKEGFAADSRHRGAALRSCDRASGHGGGSHTLG